MIFRRRSRNSDENEELETFESDEELAEDLDDEDEPEDEDPAVQRPRGPWDRDETSADEGEDGYIDLGGLVIKGATGVELRLQVENQQGSVAAVMLAAPDGGLELKAFASPRSGGIWREVRADIAAEAARMGGTVTESDGEFGTEVLLKVPIRTPDGRSGSQTSRIVGVEGPRWLLRGTFLGKAATQPDPEGALETAFRDVIVVRGGEPMAPREMIPMQMPAQAQSQLTAGQGGDGPPADQGTVD